MRVLILGIDGYIGHSLALHLLKKGYKVGGIDDFSRRRRVTEVGSNSLTPIASEVDRDNLLGTFNDFLGRTRLYLPGKLEAVKTILRHYEPDTIVHLAEMPSAPWSMMDALHSFITQSENIVGTLSLLWAMKEVCPTVHLIKLGTMGEYGTPELDIPEGMIDGCLISKDYGPCPLDRLPFPRSAGSFYHLSKVHDTHNIIFACKIWGLCSTDIMQGVVFGLNEYSSPEEITRFDYDEYFGTVVNRFCVQSLIGHPLTIYGAGGQTRGYLPLKDSLQCLTIAIDNPPSPGEYRTLNQFESTYSVNSLAKLVTECALDLGLKVDSGPIDNPRVEAEKHYYNPVHQKLFKLGYVPTTDIKGEITKLIGQLDAFKSRIRPNVILPKTKWR